MNTDNWDCELLCRALGSLIEIMGPEGTTYYTYHGAGNGLANQLATVSVSGINGTGIINGLYEAYDYDGYGRLIQKDKNIDGDTYTTYYSYDNNDNLTRKDYSNGFYLDYSYTNGYLRNVVQPGPMLQPPNTPFLFKGGAINGQGQYTSYDLLNNVTTSNNYYHGYLTSTYSPYIQEMSINYDYTAGNIINREDQLKSLSEDFTYDNLNRLTQSVVTDYGNSILRPDVTVSYDATANGVSRGTIVNKSDAGTFQPSNSGATYSAKNENSLISQNVQDIVYTPFRKTQSVKEISKDDNNNDVEYEQIFTYDANYDRVKTEVWDRTNYQHLNTRLYLDDYEVNIDPTTQAKTYIHYVTGGDGLCAIAEIQGQYYPNNDNVTYHVTYKDHLGSIVSVTDRYGNIEAEQNFDAWGKERNPQDWTYSNVSGVGLAHSWLYRGYTGHEHMPQFSIINMNGRMYDPTLSRMMSPDPYIQAPSFTQSYNRYSYCLNNPLKYTDPSGNLFIEVGLTFLYDFFRTGFSGGFDLSQNGTRRRESWAQFDPGARGSITSNAFRIEMGRFSSDRDLNFFQRVWQVQSRLTPWEGVQSTAGRFLAHGNNVSGNVESVNYFHGATVMDVRDFSNVTTQGHNTGNYIRVREYRGGVAYEANGDLTRQSEALMHEYGHYLQSRRYGLKGTIRGAFNSARFGDEDDERAWFERNASNMGHDYFRDKGVDMTGWQDFWPGFSEADMNDYTWIHSIMDFPFGRFNYWMNP